MTAYHTPLCVFIVLVYVWLTHALFQCSLLDKSFHIKCHDLLRYYSLPYKTCFHHVKALAKCLCHL